VHAARDFDRRPAGLADHRTIEFRLSDDVASFDQAGEKFVGAIGAGGACAALRRLSPEQATMAIALAASQAAGIMANFGTMTKPFHAGRAAHAGVVSARLAGLGFTAAVDALEHPQGFLWAVSPEGRVDREGAVPPFGEQWQKSSKGSVSRNTRPATAPTAPSTACWTCSPNAH